MKKKYEKFKFELLREIKRDKKEMDFDDIKELKFRFDKDLHVLVVDNFYAEGAQPIKEEQLENLQSASQLQDSITSINGVNIKYIPLDPMIELEEEVKEWETSSVAADSKVEHEDINDEIDEQQESPDIKVYSDELKELEPLTDTHIVTFELDPMVDPESIIRVEETSFQTDELEKEDSIETSAEEVKVDEDSKTLIHIEEETDVKDMHKVVFNLDPMTDPESTSFVEQVQEEPVFEEEAKAEDKLESVEEAQEEVRAESVIEESQEEQIQDDSSLVEETLAQTEEVIELEEDTDEEEVSQSKEDKDIKAESQITKEDTLDKDTVKFIPLEEQKEDFTEEDAIKFEEELSKDDLSSKSTEELADLLEENDVVFEDSKSDDLTNLIEEDLLIIDEFFKKEVNRQENDLVEKVVSNTFN